MKGNPSHPFNDLLERREFGDLLTLYFEFLKRNFKAFIQVFIRYNGLLMIGLLLSSYLLVSGFSGLFNVFGNQTMGVTPEGGENYGALLGFGILLYFVIAIIATTLNYALATGYIVHYQNTEGKRAGARDVWNLIKKRIGSSLLFMLMVLVLLAVAMFIGIFLSFIPLVGPLLFYGILFFMSAWLGMSFTAMFAHDKNLGEALGEGWDLLFKSFWTCIGVNFILGILNFILMMLLMTIPGVLIGAYAFHQFQIDGQQTVEWLDTFVFTLGVGIYLIMGILNQSLTQWVNGMLYYALHEKKYNTNTRRKIALIGNQDAG
ncbi:hypothetical protein SAMN04490243_2254 [Robiginitalea myxolifaciens]|uniref:Membrane domain of glycerophosphoryl diester phosphodiesterase n=1 Tax=Robiginitalea myxolifaciens TaxID=400055 RepID=A0A1I6H4M2_9FLAO|nr:hypothetical protein [Robiginitalea myxolifaciens]SFR49415.1 hypothetical protein SAMN04490243_2254 [Robiginitalea myxolifaciens]